jgi:hypothetical protein
MKSAAYILVLSLMAIGPAAPVWGQYFGQNKVVYGTFDFEVLTTEHFEIYYHDLDPDMLGILSRMAERWYARLSGVLVHELRGRQPLILYNSHPEFRQTNAIPGFIGDTTGGVTEALKRRIVLPLAGPLAETDHVLGHELVHAFQFDITTQRSGSVIFSLPGALRLPLWFMEGMAEYLSVGAEDAHTAMWIRDALASDTLPTVQQLSDPRFFPYRYGQALWAYIAGRGGDAAVGEILKSAGRTGDPGTAIRDVLDVSVDELSADWHKAIRSNYEAALAGSSAPETFGRRLFDDSAGELNVSPSVNPAGDRIVFFSERNLFSIDMFLADIQNGRILRRITDAVTDPHLESLQFVGSTGAWSPDGQQFAFASITNGRPRLTLIEPATGEEVSRYSLPLGEVFNPAWAPEGERLTFSAIADGVTDLFVLDLTTGDLERLTDDVFAVLHPAWSPDGNTIAFVTDRFTSDINNLRFGDYQIALLDVATGEMRPLGARLEGKQINPQWSSRGDALYLLSDATGITNLYRVDVSSGGAEQLTDLQTGITGITALSPALSLSSNNRPFVSIYSGGGYRLYGLSEPPDLVQTSVTDRSRATLPPRDRLASSVRQYLASAEQGLPGEVELTPRPYRPGLSLDYVAPPSVALGVSNFGTSFGGGTGLYWSDMLGDHNLMTAAELNTQGNVLRDLAAVVAYENRRHRWNWGAVFGQVPFRSGFFSQRLAVRNGQLVVVDEELRLWQTERNLVGTLAYPFNRAQRLEFSGGLRHIGFAAEGVTRIFSATTGQQISREEQEFPTADGLNMGVASSALVYDQAVFGGLGPVLGQRYRLEASTTVGDLSYTTGLADYRRYFMPVRPITIAARLLHFGRYGGGAEDPRLQNLYIGDENLIRGYKIGSLETEECIGGAPGTCPVFDRLVGSRIGVANLEVRTPLLGPLGVVSSFGLPVELVGFVDAGTAWGAGERASWLGGERDGVSSHGVSLRFNLLGFAIGQLSFVHPNDRPRKNWLWEFSFVQGF